MTVGTNGDVMKKYKVTIILAICFIMSFGLNIKLQYDYNARQAKYTKIYQSNKKLTKKNKYLYSENTRIRKLYMDQAKELIEAQNNYLSLKGEYDFLDNQYKEYKKNHKNKKHTKDNVSSNNVDTSSNELLSNNTVYMTDYGNKYHVAGCKYLKKSAIAISKSDAKQRGLTPCSQCNP